MNIQQLKPDGARYIDPNAPLDKQTAVLRELIKNPPENSRTISFSPVLSDWILTELLGSTNRKKKPARIKRYAAAMEREAWHLTGETIVFGKSGLLLDGQNRFAACVRAGIPFRTYVVFGIDDSVFVTINSGKARTPSDTFHTSGVVHPQIVSPAVRWIMLYENGNPTARTSFSNQEMFDFWKTKTDEDRLALAIERAMKAVKAIPLGTLAAHLYLFDKKHPPTAKRFADDLAKNVRGGRKLSDMLVRARKQNMGRLHDVWINAIVVSAWNAYRANETVTTRHLRWTEAKEYPTIA
jgi:hypothetical protein